jgi:hypothetical protein
MKAGRLKSVKAPTVKVHCELRSNAKQCDNFLSIKFALKPRAVKTAFVG